MLAAAGAMAAAHAAAGAAEYADMPAGTFASVIANDASAGMSTVDDFAMRTELVTRDEFYRFVALQPQWSRESVPELFADEDYLIDWKPAEQLSPDEARQPVTRVSWFAAQAYCESEGARLPTWNEWEYAAAADATRRDARADPAWRARILAWYAHPTGTRLATVGGAPNVYGVRDLHGLVWEWVDDFNSLLVDADSRSASDGDKLKFCGAGAISLKQRDNYAVLMRVAMLSSLKAANSTASLGFRCAKPKSKGSP
jgi:formylglycine-generating enzyme required for sulfatase activity